MMLPAALLAAGLLLPSGASAELPELRIAPLRYQAHLEIGQPKSGFVDASNPSGSPIHVSFQVEAFRQINDRGELEFYDDSRLAAAVTPALSEFDIGPREAVRARFTIDPAKLGPGGAYGVIFLRTIPTGQATGQIATSARVGTLLILDVGGTGTQSGSISSLQVPRLIFGHAQAPVTLSYSNTGTKATALAFFPKLDLSFGFAGSPKTVTGPLVFPHRARVVKTTLHPGNAIGPVPVTVHDHSGGGAPSTVWVFADTGIWASLTFFLPVVFLLWLFRKKLLIFISKCLRFLRRTRSVETVANYRRRRSN
jgi:hypothetical protein